MDFLAMSSISVIMPVFNGGELVRIAIQSVLAQQCDAFEVIIVDDGSTDDTIAQIEAFRDQRIKIVSQSNQGQSAAINRGVQESSGRYIKIVDADDWINPTHLSSQIRSVENTPGYVSACRWGYFREKFDGPDVRDEHADRDYDDPLEWIVDSLTRDEGMMGGWKWLIPREVWDHAGGYDPRLSLNNDFHASIAILLASKGVRFAPDAIYSYRKGYTSSLSRGKSRKAMESAFLTTELGCELLLKREDSPRIRAICAKRFQRWAFDFFPDFPDLTDRAELAAQQYGGAEICFPGGRTAQLISGAFGWRTVRRLQHWANRLGWGQVQQRKQKRRIAQLP
jgi:GT2 family glycosyltransferase